MQMRLNKLILAVFLLITAAVTPAAAARDAVVTVYPKEVIGRVNPLIFGNNQLAYTEKEIYGNRGSGIWSPAHLSPMPAAAAPVPDYVSLSKLAGITINRWPNATIYNWKLTVGPVRDRLKKQFGLPEFLAFCRATHAVPLITISVDEGNAQDAADLVEYLNQPNDGANPNGGTDWAAVRASDGHPEPYGVIWFEFGNEKYGDSPKTKENPNPLHISPEDYAGRYLIYQAAMKAVDPHIKLGACMEYGEWTWTRKVLEGCGKKMDFAIEHTYVPSYKANDDSVERSLIAKACMAADADIQNRYDWFHKEFEEVTGRRDLMLAITEYNGHFVQEKPIPYRQTLVNALRNAENLRVMMEPKNHILMANFWQFANEYWGMVQGYTHLRQVPVKQANFFPFQLYHEHFGDKLIKTNVRCNTWDFVGAAGVQERSGRPREFKLWQKNLLPKNYRWEGKIIFGPARLNIDGKIATVNFNGEDFNFHHAKMKMPVEPSTGYRITGYIKTENLTDKAGVTFEIEDGRGWAKTHSIARGIQFKGTSDWVKVQVDYVTLSGAKEINILTRRLGGEGPVKGKASFRLESVQKFQPANAGAVPDVSVNSAIRRDGTVTVIIVNKNTEEAVPVQLKIAGSKPRKNAAKAWLLSGPSCFATNLKDPNSVGVNQVPVGLEKDGYYLKMSPCSMAAIEIKP